MKIKLSIILEKLSEMDWLFGNLNAVNKVKYTDNWWQYKPTEETQRYSRFDPWDCTSRSKCNILETLFNYKIKNGLFGKKALDFLNGKNCLKVSYFDAQGSINFLDKFSAILSGTRAYVGNTFKAPADAIRNYGLVPEQAFPWTKYDLERMEAKDYYNEATINFLKPLGEEFLSIFKLNYEVLGQRDFNNAIWYSPVECGVAAWYYDNGYYYNGGRFNHDCCVMKIQSHYEVFDSYSPYIKNLSPNYKFMDNAYVWFVEERENYMKLKPGFRYVALCGNHKEYGFAKLDKRDNLTKMIVGDRDEILNLFVDENAGNIANRVLTVAEKDWKSTTHYNTRLEMINI
jgi:hypothetical protein